MSCARSLLASAAAGLLALACTAAPTPAPVVEVLAVDATGPQIGALIAAADIGAADGVPLAVRPIEGVDLAAALADLAPPALVVHPLDDLAAVVASGHLSPDATGGLLRRLGRPTFVSAALDLLADADGSQLALPLAGTGDVVVVDPTALAATGDDVPSSLGGLAALVGHDGARADGTVVAVGGPGTVEHLALAAGCDLLAADGRSALLGPACVEGLQTVRSLVGVPLTTTDAAAELVAGRAAVAIGPGTLLDAVAGGCPPRCAPGHGAADPLGRLVVLADLARPGGAPSARWDVTALSVLGDGPAVAAAGQLLLDRAYDLVGPGLGVPLRTGTPSDPERFARAWVARQLRPGGIGEPAATAVLQGVAGLDRWAYGRPDGFLVADRLAATDALADLVDGIADPQVDLDVLLAEVDDAIGER